MFSSYSFPSPPTVQQWIILVDCEGKAIWQWNINDSDANRRLKRATAMWLTFCTPEICHEKNITQLAAAHLDWPQMYMAQTWTQPTHSLKQSFSQIVIGLQTHERGNKCLVNYWILECVLMKHYLAIETDTDSLWYHLRIYLKYIDT